MLSRLKFHYNHLEPQKLSSCRFFYRKDMEAAKEKNQQQKRKGSETQSCFLPDPLLCRAYEAVLRKLKSKWCLSSIPRQLRPYQMTASHRHQRKRCSHCSSFQSNFNSFYRGCLFILPPLSLAVRAATVMLLLQVISPLFCPTEMNREKQPWSKAKIK